MIKKIDTAKAIRENDLVTIRRVVENMRRKGCTYENLIEHFNHFYEVGRTEFDALMYDIDTMEAYRLEGI